MSQVTTTLPPANDQVTTIVVSVIILLILIVLGVYSIWSYPKDDILQNTVNLANAGVFDQHKEEFRPSKDDVVREHPGKKHKHTRRHRR